MENKDSCLMNQTVLDIIALPYLFEIKILSLLDEIMSLYH